MKLHTLVYPIFTASLLTLTTAKQSSQKPMDLNPGPVSPPQTNPSLPPSAQPGSDGDTVILTDVLGRDRTINIFAGFTRDISTVDSRLSDQTVNTTVLAPLNSAITSLPRKPWEDARDYSVLGANAYEGEEGEDRAHRNLRRFVEEHVVLESPWEEGAKVETMGGSKVWWEKKDGKTLVQPGNIEVASVASTVANGEVWILKNARNYA